MFCSLFNQFEYPKKSRLVNFADVVLSPLRHMFHGKTIECYHLSEDTATFVESRPFRSPWMQTLGKVAAFAGALLSSPLIIPSLIVKKTNQQDGVIAKRYCRHSSTDNFWKAPLLSNDPITSLTAKIFLKLTGFDSLTTSMQIHGDEILRKLAPGNYEGGHFLPVSEMMLKKVKLLAGHIDSEVSTACQKAEKSLKNLFDMSKKMAPITLSHIFSIKYLLNPKKRVQDLAEDVADVLKHLDIGGSFMIPLNFYTSTQGFRHITTTIKRLDNDEYEWHIFRADTGCEEKNKTAGQCKVADIILSGLTRSQITKKKFLGKILGYGTARKPDQGERFFKFLRKYAGKYDNVAISEGKTTKKLPASDTLSLKTLKFALKELMGTIPYKKAMFLLKLDDLSALKEKIEKERIAGVKQMKHAKKLLRHAEEKLKKRYEKIKNMIPKFSLSEKQLAFIKKW